MESIRSDGAVKLVTADLAGQDYGIVDNAAQAGHCLHHRHRGQGKVDKSVRSILAGHRQGVVAAAQRDALDIIDIGGLKKGSTQRIIQSPAQIGVVVGIQSIEQIDAGRQGADVESMCAEQE